MRIMAIIWIYCGNDIYPRESSGVRAGEGINRERLFVAKMIALDVSHNAINNVTVAQNRH